MPDVERWIARARRGDSEAARHLVAETYPLVLRIVRAHAPRDGVSVDDWAQEVYLRMFARLDQYRGGVPFEHWLARVASNACRDLGRTSNRRREVQWSDLDGAANRTWERVIAEGPDVADPGAARELVDVLLDTLSADDRAVIRLVDLEERPVAEVAETLGKGLSWVKVRAHRARIKLRTAFERLSRREREA